jgi:GR25 family glycosyltransferase involved in LPS biosynthesis
MIYDFYYNSDENFAVICEDDILLHERCKEIIEKIMKNCVDCNFDMVLLGYLLPYKIGLQPTNKQFQPITKPIQTRLSYFYIPEYLSGTQMYMITKKYARYILKKYYNNYAEIMNNYYIIDKILTTNGNNTLLYPMIGLENSEQEDPYHKLCHKIHFNHCYK